MKWAPQWLSAYRRSWIAGDLTAGLIVAVMLIAFGARLRDRTFLTTHQAFDSLC